jgi:hypothetical protein
MLGKKNFPPVVFPVRFCFYRVFGRFSAWRAPLKNAIELLSNIRPQDLKKSHQKKAGVVYL